MIPFQNAVSNTRGRARRESRKANDNFNLKKRLGGDMHSDAPILETCRGEAEVET